MAPAQKSIKRKGSLESDSVVKGEVKSEAVVKEEPDDREIKTEPEDSFPSSGKCPPSWERVYANILKMREGRDAPVDNMGCEKSHDSEAEPHVIISIKKKIFSHS